MSRIALAIGLALFVGGSCKSGHESGQGEEWPKPRPDYACREGSRFEGDRCVPGMGCGKGQLVESVLPYQQCESNANGQVLVEAGDMEWPKPKPQYEVDVLFNVADAATPGLESKEFDPARDCEADDSGACPEGGMVSGARVQAAYDGEAVLGAVLPPGREYYPAIVGGFIQPPAEDGETPVAVVPVALEKTREAASHHLAELDPRLIEHYFFSETYAPAIRDYCVSARQFQTILTTTSRDTALFKLSAEAPRRILHARAIRTDDVPGEEEVRAELGHSFRMRFIGPVSGANAEDYSALIALQGVVNLYVIVEEEDGACEPFFHSGSDTCHDEVIEVRGCDGPPLDRTALDGGTYIIDCLFAGCFVDPPQAALLARDFTNLGSCPPGDPPVAATFRLEDERVLVTAGPLYPQSGMQDPFAVVMEGHLYFPGESGCFQWEIGEMLINNPVGSFVFEETVAFGEFSGDLERIEHIALLTWLDTVAIEEGLGMVPCDFFPGICDEQRRIRIRIRMENITARLADGPAMSVNLCGNGRLDEGEQCDAGWLNGRGPDCNLTCTGPVPATCGNGITDGGEACDTSTPDIPCTDRGCYPSGRPCLTDCSGHEPYCRVEPYYCGDGLRQGCEECDDGNLDEADGCDLDCRRVLICGASLGATLDARDPVTGHCYAYFANLLGWTESQSACEVLGGHLAVIESDEEVAIAAQAIPTGQRGWIGVSDHAIEAGTDPMAFQSVLGGTVAYAHFAPGEPGAGGDPVDDCVLINEAGWWDDTACVAMPYLCEIP